MIHVYDAMSSVAGQLNILNKDYTGRGRAHTMSKTPDFILLAINRMIDMFPDMVDPNAESISVEKSIISGTGNSFAPVYISTVSGITRAAVDKITVIVDHKGDHGPGIATIVIVPSFIFNTETNSINTVNVLKDIYFGMLELDGNTSFKASAAMLQFYNNPKLKIPLYDTEMIIAAICFMNLNMKAWFYDNGVPVDPSYTLDAFSDKEVPKEFKERLFRVMKKCNSVSDIRDAIGNGRLLRNFMYDDTKE